MTTRFPHYENPFSSQVWRARICMGSLDLRDTTYYPPRLWMSLGIPWPARTVNQCSLCRKCQVNLQLFIQYLLWDEWLLNCLGSITQWRRDTDGYHTHTRIWRLGNQVACSRFLQLTCAEPGSALAAPISRGFYSFLSLKLNVHVTASKEVTGFSQNHYKTGHVFILPSLENSQRLFSGEQSEKFPCLFPCA